MTKKLDKWDIILLVFGVPALIGMIIKYFFHLGELYTTYKTQIDWIFN
jgi:hypothetical protein